MELKEKVAYIKGMMEGMEFDTATKEGKLLAAVVDVLEEMAKEVTNIDEDVDTLYDEVDAMSEDLEDVENFLLDGGDEDEDDYDEEYEAGLYEITCPQCGEVVCVDEDMLANDDLACPNCGTKFEVDFSEDDDACEGCEGCCGGKDDSWTEAILYDDTGREVVATEPCDGFTGCWELKDEDTNTVYRVHVMTKSNLN